MYVLIFVKFVYDFFGFACRCECNEGGVSRGILQLCDNIIPDWGGFNCVSLLCRGGALGESYVVSECTLVA